jgi:hypothetical protein
MRIGLLVAAWDKLFSEFLQFLEVFWDVSENAQIHLYMVLQEMHFEN